MTSSQEKEAKAFINTCTILYQENFWWNKPLYKRILIVCECRSMNVVYVKMMQALWNGSDRLQFACSPVSEEYFFNLFGVE